MSEVRDSAVQRQIEAASVIVDCHRVLARGGDNVVSDVLRGRDFVEWEHYPEDDARDPLTSAQYYFHSHPAENGDRDYGHFHLFLGQAGLPEEARPTAQVGSEIPVHLIGISVTREGLPDRLFTTNAWVTGEPWYPAEIVIGLLNRFEIDVASPSWLLNRWVSAMVVLFRPQIEQLIVQRDLAIAAWLEAHPRCDVLEDRRLEYPSSAGISLIEQISWIESLKE